MIFNTKKLLIKDTIQCRLLPLYFSCIIFCIYSKHIFFNPFVKVVKDFSLLNTTTNVYKTIVD